MLSGIVSRRFWRIVKHNPPDETDFWSHTRRGLRPIGAEAEGDGYDAVSVHDTLDGMSIWQRRFRIRGFIAELRIPDGAPVRWRQEGAPGHYNLWGDPELLLSYVVLPLTGEGWW
jgi:hypothetical protein